MTGRLVHLGKTLQSRIRDFFDSPIDGAATPLEVVQGALAILERKVQPVGRGRRVFPYNRVTVRVGPGIADRASLQAAFEHFDEKLRERLAELKCAAPAGLAARLVFVKRAPADWTSTEVFRVECTVEAEPGVATTTAPRQPTLDVSIVKGAATQPAYTFTQPIVCIGRTEDPVDVRGNVRRNHVIFVDTIDGVTETVGRAHARIDFDGEHGEYRIFNEGSSNPTFIARAGTTIQVQPRDPRGVRVRSGDEIQLGRALIRINLVAAPVARPTGPHEEQLQTTDVAG